MRSCSSCELVPEVSTYNSLLKACWKARAWERSLSLVREMPKCGRNPNQESWDLAFATCADAGRWECCYGIVEMMISQIVSGKRIGATEPSLHPESREVLDPHETRAV